VSSAFAGTPPEKPLTTAPTANTGTSITFNGTLNPGASPQGGVYQFLYKKVANGAGCEGENATPGGAVAGLGPEPVSESEAVEPDTEYTVCLAATNTEPTPETTVGNAIVFKTKALPPEIAAGSESASPIAATEATLNAQINPNNQETTYIFEYSEKENAGVLEAPVTKLSGGPLEGYPGQGVQVGTGAVLHADKTYYYRVTAENVKGEKAAAGAVAHFQTAPETPELQETESLAATTVTLKGVLDLNATVPGEAGTYEFLYRSSASECQGEHGQATPRTAALGHEAEAVSAPLTGLLPDTTYTFCLLERNAAGQTAIGAPTTFTTRGPGISEEQVTTVEPRTATLQAKINPNESETTYHFEYDTTPYTSSAPHGTSLPSAVILAGPNPVPVSVELPGLQPHATYYYRIVATSEPTGTPETFDGPDKTFTTNAPPTTSPETCPNAQPRTEQPYGLTLPDCRAYEMVSPLDKGDNSIIEQHARSSLSGEALTYESVGSFADPQATDYADRYMARRGATGWSTSNITPPYQPIKTNAPEPFNELWFTPELSTGLFDDENGYPLNEGVPAGYNNLYLADTAAGATPGSDSAYQLVSTVSPKESESGRYRDGNPLSLYVDGASTDLSHVVFGEKAALTPGAPKEAGLENVYEWTQGSSVLHLVNVPPTGKSFLGTGGGSAGAPGVFSRPENGNVWHAVTTNGSRVFFTAAEEGELGQLYLRENPEQPPADASDCAVPQDACTIEVSESQRTGPHGEPDPDPHGTYTRVGSSFGLPRVARYWDANAEGSRVFFTSDVELTNDAQTGPADNAPNLYEYNVETKQLTDLSVDELTAKGEDDIDGAAVLGLVTASEDGSYVYFVAEGNLAQGATSGQPNLYLHHAGQTSFIATLVPATFKEEGRREQGGDSADWAGEKPEPDVGAPANDFGPGSHTVRVTADGTTLAFQSQQPLTGYDTEQAQTGDCEGGIPGSEGQKETGRCSQVYLYDAATGSTSCASCDPSGARPIGPARLGPELAGGAFTHTLPFYEPRNLSTDGGRLFFESPDPLVPHDSNGASGCPLSFANKPTCQDVYEWELPATASEAATGENSCTQASPDFSPADGGCVFPISDVAGDNESFFLDATPSGNDVFIATADQLVPSDTDQKLDVYDVRSGGGFPVAPAPPVCVNADSCKSPETPQPGVFGAPASATFAGPANPPPPPPAVVKPAVKPKPLTRAQKLANALKVCAKDKQKPKRAKCQKQAKSKYGVATKSTKKKGK